MTSIGICPPRAAFDLLPPDDVQGRIRGDVVPSVIRLPPNSRTERNQKMTDWSVMSCMHDMAGR